MENLLLKIDEKKTFTFDETFETYKLCSKLIASDKILAQKLLVNILDNLHKFDIHLNEILAQIIESIGFYPYIDKEKFILDSTDSKIRKNYHYSDNINKFLHEDQKYLLSLMSSDKNVVVSAPTSFGKSLLIEELVASKKFKNIIIIQPTLALLDETRKKLKKYDEFYKLIIKTSQYSSTEKGNIYLFTAERVNEYQNFKTVDFIVVDEFYKLSSKRDDERADSLNNALHFVLKTFKSKFYLLGPNIDGISEGFEEKYNAIFYKTKTSLVDTKIIDIFDIHKDKFKHPIKFKEYKEEILFNLLLENSDQQNIIYCSSPARVRYLSKKFSNFIDSKIKNYKLAEFDIFEWIERNINSKWSVINILKRRIGIHDGALQKHITTSVIDYFNNGLLNYLFCTSTIIEGVNTSAKNIFYFDSTKGLNKKIDFFDYSNIKGRAGRLMQHYTGAVYNFNPIPKNEIIKVDIPFFEQNPISNEVLIQLDDHEIKDKLSKQYQFINSIPYAEKNVIARNGVHVEGQLGIINQLRHDIQKNYDLVCWSGFPSKEQLEYSITLSWNFLLKENEIVRPMTLKSLIAVTNIYSYNHDIWNLINNNFKYYKTLEKNRNTNDDDLMDEAIRNSFQILKHWFEYKIPKWLSVIDSLQKFVCSEYGIRAGNYNHFANQLENDFLRDNLAILSEYGIPSSAIRKLEKLIPANKTQDEVIELIRNKLVFNNEIFLEYEKNKLMVI
ncbi:DEAD/DEAH box helicase [Acinetobacter sp. 187]|uniref:DEAD/DEAH box helicase n=1 Tax=Acinetobacter lanii TaxID=2715163 RepID=UPI00140BC75A|nr:DEAD/DEAH box helicase [Acinetobacter lanii]NHC02398.1 DEAD/DEAH box helicase [Acinetobacter lanii]